MNFADYKDGLDEFVNKTEVEWQACLDWWKTTTPEPVMEEVIKRVVPIPVKFWFILSAAIGAFSLSAFRVSERFYSVALKASGGDLFFTYGETVSAVFAVNMSIFALAIVVAYMKKKTNDTSTQVGLVVAIAISSIAGLGQAIAGLGLVDWVNVVDLLLAFVMGLGVTALEYLTGDMLGVELVNYFNDKLDADSDYSVRYDSARSLFVHEHKQWLSAAKGRFGAFIANARKFTGSSLNESEQPPAVHERASNHKTNIVNREDVVNLLGEQYRRNHTIPGVSELTRMLAYRYMRLDVNNLTADDEQNVRAFVTSKKGNVSQIRKTFIDTVGDVHERDDEQ